MEFQAVSSGGLTFQFIGTVFLGGVSLAAKHFLNKKPCLIKLIDIIVRRSTMFVPSLLPSSLQDSRPTTRSRLKHLVCLSLVSYGQSRLFSTSDLDMIFRFSGRYPWAIEDALHKYGDVVRIAPNELVFFTPQAFLGWYMTLASQGFL